METLTQLATARRTEVRDLPGYGRVVLDSFVIHFPLAHPSRLPPESCHYADPSRLLERSYLNKPLVSVGGKSLFGELAIAQCLEQDGWQAVWVDSYHGRGKGLFWKDLPDRSTSFDITTAPTAAEIFDRIRAQNDGRIGGFFDVLAWRGSEVAFVEYKGPGDRPNRNEIRWIDAALATGLSTASLSFVLNPR